MDQDAKQAEDEKSPIDEQVRVMFRQGQYAQAVPVISGHLQAHPDDRPAYELMSDALKYSGDKPGAAAALVRASELFAAAGQTVQSIAAQKKAAKLGVEPDWSALRAIGSASGVTARVVSPLFDDLSAEEFAEMAERLESVSYDDGDVVVQEGSAGESMGVIVKGAISVTTKQAGADVTLATLGPGDFFGETALLSGRARTATLTAAAPTECLMLSMEEFVGVTAQHPRVLQVMEEFNRKRAEATVEALIHKRRKGH